MENVKILSCICMCVRDLQVFQTPQRKLLPQQSDYAGPTRDENMAKFVGFEEKGGSVKKLHSQHVQDGADPMSEDDICDEIFGIRPGYTRGLGHGKVPMSSYSSSSFNSEIIDLTKRAEEAEKLNKELKECMLDQDKKIEEMKASQDRKMEKMRANMEGMAAKLEAFISKFGRDSSSWSASRE